MEEALRAFLLAGAGVAALIDDRATWGLRAQGQPMPAIGLQGVSRGRSYTMRGPSGLTDHLVQIDCWASSYRDAKALERAVVARLDEAKTAPLQAFVEDVREDFEAVEAPASSGATGLYRSSLDVRVWHTEGA